MIYQEKREKKQKSGEVMGSNEKKRYRGIEKSKEGIIEILRKGNLT